MAFGPWYPEGGLFTIFNACRFEYCGKWEASPRKPLNHTSWVMVLQLTTLCRSAIAVKTNPLGDVFVFLRYFYGCSVSKGACVM